MYYAIVEIISVDDGYGGTTEVKKFSPMESKNAVLNWIHWYGKHTTYEVIMYEPCKVLTTVDIVKPEATR